MTPGPLALADELGGPEGPASTAVEVLYGSSALPGGELLTLVSVMDTLRRRCPWDARQTHESLAPYLIEESMRRWTRWKAATGRRCATSSAMSCSR